MPKSRGRKPKKPRAPTKGAPKQLIAHNTPPREPPIPAQTVQQEPSLSPQTVQQESSIPRQTLLQSILKWTGGVSAEAVRPLTRNAPATRHPAGRGVRHYRSPAQRLTGCKI